MALLEIFEILEEIKATLDLELSGYKNRIEELENFNKDAMETNLKLLKIATRLRAEDEASKAKIRKMEEELSTANSAKATIQYEDKETQTHAHMKLARVNPETLV